MGRASSRGRLARVRWRPRVAPRERRSRGAHLIGERRAEGVGAREHGDQPLQVREREAVAAARSSSRHLPPRSVTYSTERSSSASGPSAASTARRNASCGGRPDDVAIASRSRRTGTSRSAAADVGGRAARSPGRGAGTPGCLREGRPSEPRRQASDDRSGRRSTLTAARSRSLKRDATQGQAVRRRPVGDTDTAHDRPCPHAPEAISERAVPASARRAGRSDRCRVPTSASRRWPPRPRAQTEERDHDSIRRR